MRKLVDGNDIVTIHCYGRTKEMKRDQAIREFIEAMNWSEGSEHERYSNIFLDLICGKMECWDE